jgi:hypothetical protein
MSNSTDKSVPDRIFWDGENTSSNNECFLAFAGPIIRPEQNDEDQGPHIPGTEVIAGFWV